MRFRVRHVTRYDYERSERLGVTTVRLRPRSDAGQRLLAFDLACDPAPLGRSEAIDAEGNQTTRLWFDAPAAHLLIATEFQAETLRDNPYDWVLDPDACVVPMRYDAESSPALAAYRATTAEPEIEAFARSVLTDSGPTATVFLSAMCERLASSIEQQRRDEGDPRPPAETLAAGRGACRDVAALFIEACRTVGLAARFVSGYTAPSPDVPSELHAWAEVYLPDGGWRGYDPSLGLAVADTHVAVATAAAPRGAAPVQGTFSGAGGSRLTSDVEVRVEA